MDLPGTRRTRRLRKKERKRHLRIRGRSLYFFSTPAPAGFQITWLVKEIAQEKMIPQNQARKVAVGKLVSSVGGTEARTSSIGESSRCSSKEETECASEYFSFKSGLS
jgi:hypothetical protein